MKLKRDLREYSLPVNIDDKSGLSSGEENNQDRRRTNLKGKAIFTLVSIRGKAPPFNIPVVDCPPPKKSEWNPPHIETGGISLFVIYQIDIQDCFKQSQSLLSAVFDSRLGKFRKTP